MLTYISGQLFFAYRDLSGENSSLQNRLAALKIDSEHLKSDLEYFKSPENLEKELRSKFNYKNPGEKLVIGVLQIGASDIATSTQSDQGATTTGNR